LRQGAQERESQVGELEQRIRSVVDRASGAQAHAASLGIELPAHAAETEPTPEPPEPEEPEAAEQPEPEEAAEQAAVTEPEEEAEPGLLHRVAETRRARREERRAKRAAREKEAGERRAAREREDAERKAAREQDLAESKKASERETETEQVAEPEPAPPPQPSTPKPDSGGRGPALDVNTATFEELRELGLSVTQATRVIAYRERRDGFNTIDDLDAVPGFPKGLVEQLRDRLTV
jgi:competence ComEA-like helix-hairpin-helix protein